MAEVTDQVLAGALARGDRAAFAALFDRHAPALFRLAQRLLGAMPGAEDLVQTTWERLLRQPPRLSADQSLLPWLRKVLVRLAIDEGRRQTRRRTFDGGLQPGAGHADPGPSPEDLADRAEDRLRVRRALGTLPPDQRAILVLLHGEGLRVREVARILGLGETVVKNRAFRARRRMRILLAAQEGEVVRRVPIAEGAADAEP